MKTLLSPSMEEDLIDNRARDEDLNTTSSGASGEKIVGGGVKPRKTVSKKNTKKVTKNTNINKSVKKPKQVLNKKRSTHNPFKPEEDKILLEAMRSGEELDFKELAKTINRKRTSVQGRMEKLKLSGGVSSTTNPRYTLQEDLKIIDSAVENLKIFSKLDATPLKDSKDLAASFRRNADPVKERWEVRLKVWIKSYYTKTLNLDIRVMLANVVADNFKNIESIDWNFVISFKEFSGHTLRSIRYQFYSQIYQRAKVKFKGDKADLTLREIATIASKESAKKIPASTRKRQEEVIEYFEKKVKELGIKDFV